MIIIIILTLHLLKAGQPYQYHFRKGPLIILITILTLHLLKAGAALPVSFQKRTLDHPHHHHHITPVKMRESLKFSFLPTSSSPPAVVSAIILSNNFANKV